MMRYEPDLPIDPPEDKVFAVCDYCGGEIYEGETYYDIDRKNIHVDCLRDFASDYFANCIEEAEVYAEAYR